MIIYSSFIKSIESNIEKNKYKNSKLKKENKIGDFSDLKEYVSNERVLSNFRENNRTNYTIFRNVPFNSEKLNKTKIFFEKKNKKIEKIKYYLKQEENGNIKGDESVGTEVVSDPQGEINQSENSVNSENTGKKTDSDIKC